MKAGIIACDGVLHPTVGTTVRVTLAPGVLMQRSPVKQRGDRGAEACCQPHLRRSSGPMRNGVIAATRVKVWWRP